MKPQGKSEPPPTTCIEFNEILAIKFVHLCTHSSPKMTQGKSSISADQSSGNIFPCNAQTFIRCCNAFCLDLCMLGDEAYMTVISLLLGSTSGQNVQLIIMTMIISTLLLYTTCSFDISFLDAGCDIPVKL